DQPIPEKTAHIGAKASPLSLSLKKGMQIQLIQDPLALKQNSISNNLSSKLVQTLTILNPSETEGLVFDWERNLMDPSSNPLQGLGTNDSNLKGNITLANMTTAHRMTLPLFWPQGELFLSNSSAVWMSDQAFEELKRNGKTDWDPGILNNALFNPSPEDKWIE